MKLLDRVFAIVGSLSSKYSRTLVSAATCGLGYFA